MRALGSFDMELQDVFVPDELVLGQPDEAWHMLLPTLVPASGSWTVCSRTRWPTCTSGGPSARRSASSRRCSTTSPTSPCGRTRPSSSPTHAAWLGETGQDVFLSVTMGKVIASEHAVNAADLGIQIFGGQGYSARTDMQRYWRDARLMPFSPVTNEMARNLVVERLGLPGSF